MKLTRNQLITINALLCAIVLLFVLVPISIGTVQLAFIPLVAIIISAEVVGLKNGIITGLFFGIVSFISSFSSPSILYFAFNNPLVSVLPRILIGIGAYYAAFGFKKLFPKLPPVISYGVGAAAGVIINTVGVLGMILALYHGRTLSIGSAINMQFISAIVIANSLLEILICTVITPPIVLAIKMAFKNKW